jgi:CxxC motif-containing protein
MSRQMICIACPLGCRLDVTRGPGDTIAVTGNRCPRGEAYGREEALSPRRIVTAVVPTGSADFPVVPVRTDLPLARALIPELLRTLYARMAPLPIRQGDVLIEEFLGVRVIFTRSLPPDYVPSVGEPGSEPER